MSNPNSTAFAYVRSATFTRPNNSTPYVIGQLVANSTTAGSVVPLSFPGAVIAQGCVSLLRSVRIRKSGTTTANASFRVHFFNASPTSAAGDGATFATTGSASMLARFDVSTDQAYSDGANGRGKSMQGDDVEFTISSGNTLYALIEARGAYTPAANETFDVVLELLRFMPQ